MPLAAPHLRRAALAAHVALSLLILLAGRWLAPAGEHAGWGTGAFEFGHATERIPELARLGPTASTPAEQLAAAAGIRRAPEALSAPGDDLKPRLRPLARREQPGGCDPAARPRVALSSCADRAPLPARYLTHRSLLC